MHELELVLALLSVVALALPLTLPSGGPFPERDLIIFLTFCVILATLVGQGLTLPWLIRRLGVCDGGDGEREELHARALAAQAAAARIDELTETWPDHPELVDNLRSRYEHGASHVPSAPSTDGSPSNSAEEQELIEHRLIRHQVLEVEREAIIELRDRGIINDAVLHRIERDLDLEEVRMEA